MVSFLSPMKRARLERGLSQLDVYLRTGIPASRLSLAERGLVRLRPEEAKIIEAELGVAPEKKIE